MSFLFLMRLSPPRPTLFPYTTLFRSHPLALPEGSRDGIERDGTDHDDGHAGRYRATPGGKTSSWVGQYRPARSEEHTSELQSRRELVCRLLLEKKKNGKGEITVRPLR